MTGNTKGIVFQSVKYSDTSIIVKIYTEAHGLQSYMIKGVRSKKAKMKTALFQPLQLLELVAGNRENKNLNYLKEAKVAHAYQSVPFDMTKRSVLMFLTEMLVRSVKEESANQTLFHWLWQTLIWYDLADNPGPDFHLVFLIQLTKFLGFYPKNPTMKSGYFDLQEGVFVNSEPPHPHYISGGVSELFHQLSLTSFNGLSHLALTTGQRRKMLNILITYYQLHLSGFGEVKSLEVLHQLFEP
jgi:DNA repair protein RecO (recombination protein O)